MNNFFHGIPELNSEYFTVQNYAADWWERLNISICDSIDARKIYEAGMKYIIGYCDAMRLSCRPKEGYYAVLIEKEGERFWFHYNKRLLELADVNYLGH